MRFVIVVALLAVGCVGQSSDYEHVGYSYALTPPFLQVVTASPTEARGVMQLGQDANRFISQPVEGAPFSVTFQDGANGFVFTMPAAATSSAMAVESKDAVLRSFDYLGHECVDWAGDIHVKSPPAWRLTLNVVCAENSNIQLEGDWKAEP